MAQSPEEAIDRFQQGFNCAQAVLSGFAPRFGVDPDQALRLAGPFGAGIARRGDMCGAASGALMVLGLRFGTAQPKDLEAKRRMYARAQEFLDRFAARFGSVDCRSLLGLDVSLPGNVELAEQHGLFTSLCPAFVRGAAEIAEAIAA